MAASFPDRNLLYGVVARRLGVVPDSALLDALGDWCEHPEGSLGLVLLERRSISPEDHGRVEAELRRITAGSSVSGSDVETVDFVTSPTARLSGNLPRSAPHPDDEARTQADPGTRQEHHPASDASTVADPNLTSPSQESGREIPVDHRFRVVGFHARGGLGKVSRAWDDQLGRQVALKEMLPDKTNSEERRARFILEAEINGNLEHPGIVPVYALGRFPDGRPYYAMRFVEGETLKVGIDRFHRQAPNLSAAEWTLGLRRLLGHFLDVCDAIAYAHSRGVLHRDIKPSNILLGGYGQTHIIDWGLAKATGRPEPGPAAADGPTNQALHTSISGTTETLAGCVLGSPAYMSPEQAAGRIDDLDRSSDIYNLGATLYAILTGREPVKAESTKATLELVRRGAIDPPRSVNPRVPPPLESICCKAMRLEPTDRYPSVRALAEDILRWLADEPVSVHHESLTTRTIRWARRHKSLVSAASALVLTALVALTVATAIVRKQRNQARQARDETKVALAQTEEARRLAEFHALNGVKLINELVTLGDRQFISTNVAPERRRQLLESALHFIRTTREGQASDVNIQVESALVARRLAHLYGLGGDLERADPLFKECVSAFEQLATRDPHSVFFRDLLAEALIDQAECRQNGGQIQGALEPITRAVGYARQNLTQAPYDPNAQRVFARSLYRSSDINRRLGQAPTPDPSVEAVERLRPLADASLTDSVAEVEKGRFHALTDQFELAAALVFQADALAAQGESGEAQLRQAVDRIARLAALFEGQHSPDIQYFQGWTGTSLARTLLKTPEHYEEARRLLDDAIQRLGSLVEENREFLHFQNALAEALIARADLNRRDRLLPAALDDAEAARSMLATLAKAHPPIADYTSLRGAAEEILGHFERENGRLDPAREHFDEAIRLQELALKSNPKDPEYLGRMRSHRESLAALDAVP
jgi:serine/threonine-protein kinase